LKPTSSSTPPTGSSCDHRVPLLPSETRGLVDRRASRIRSKNLTLLRRVPLSELRYALCHRRHPRRGDCTPTAVDDDLVPTRKSQKVSRCTPICGFGWPLASEPHRAPTRDRFPSFRFHHGDQNPFPSLPTLPRVLTAVPSESDRFDGTSPPTAPALRRFARQGRVLLLREIWSRLCSRLATDKPNAMASASERVTFCQYPS